MYKIKVDKYLWYTRYYRYQTENQLERLQRLESMLPHGSGINGNWTLKYGNNNRIYATNCYSAMDEHGCYCHHYDFTARIQYNGKDKSKPEYEFISLNFHGQREYSCCGYELKNYLADTITECLSYSQEKG